MSQRSISNGINYSLMEKENVGNKKFKPPKALIDYTQTVDDVYENLEACKLFKKAKEKC